MIRKVASPILFFIFFAFISACNNYTNEAAKYNSLKEKGDTALYKKMQLDSAYFYYNLANESGPDKKDEAHTYILLQMATIQQHIGDFFGSEATVTEALTHNNDTLYKPYLYNMLAVSYDKQKKYDDALLYYKKAFVAFENDTAKAIAQNNIGLIYLEKNQPEKAINKLKPLLENPYLKANKIEMARVLDNLGYAQFKLNRPEAYSNLSKSLKLRDSLQDIIGSIPSNIHLSEFFKSTNKIQAKKYAFNALLLAKKVNSPDDKLESLRWIIESSEPQIAKQYVSDFFKLNDSLTISRNSAKNQFAKIKYDSTTALKNLEIQKEQKNRYFILLLSVVLLSTLLYFLIRSKNKNKLKTISYQTETRLAKKIHDELANDVYQAMTYAETQDLQDLGKKETLLESLDNIYTRTRNISQQNSEIQTGKNYGNELINLLNSFNSDKVSIIVNNSQSILWDTIKKESKIALYRVLQELMVNMKKHSQSSVVIIGFVSLAKTIEVKYSDNGKGTKQIDDSQKGLQNVENRIHDIKGTVIFEPETTKGFRVTITIPK